MSKSEAAEAPGRTDSSLASKPSSTGAGASPLFGAWATGDGSFAAETYKIETVNNEMIKRVVFIFLREAEVVGHLRGTTTGNPNVGRWRRAKALVPTVPEKVKTRNSRAELNIPTTPIHVTPLHPWC